MKRERNLGAMPEQLRGKCECKYQREIRDSGRGKLRKGYDRRFNVFFYTGRSYSLPSIIARF